MNQRDQRLRQFLRAIRLPVPRGCRGRALSDRRTKRRFCLEPPDRSNDGCGIPARDDEAIFAVTQGVHGHTDPVVTIGNRDAIASVRARPNPS